MKTYKNIFSQFATFDALYAAYIRARRGKRHLPEVLMFESNLEHELIHLQNELIWDEYETGPYRRFYVHEPKKRLVAALPFRDRVVQHALVGAIEPIWESRFICHSYACRPGKGMHAGADQAQRWLRDVRREHGHVYALKADVAKYFASIDRGVLLDMLGRRIACDRTMKLCADILGTWSPGIPIGNLTSQLWANIYLHELDMFVKQQIGAARYVRYMDDFVIVHHDKAYLHAVRREITDWLETHLTLRLNNKTQVFHVARRHGRALDFLGYRMWVDRRKLRPDSIKRMRRRMRHMQGRYARGEIQFADVRQRIASWEGHARRANSRSIRQQLFSQHVFQRGSHDK